MSRFTVCWNKEAEDELAKMWLDSDDRADVECAANTVDAILSSPDAEIAGREVTTDTLDVETRAAVVQRSTTIPRQLRSLRQGPIEVLFTAHPLDRQTKVWLVRPCAK